MRSARAWWVARSATFRRGTRTILLLLVTGLVSLALGVTTASADSPVGPHQAQWRVTLSSQVAVDLGPLGTAWVRSPVAPLGVGVRIAEIPGSPDAGAGTGTGADTGTGVPGASTSQEADPAATGATDPAAAGASGAPGDGGTDGAGQSGGTDGAGQIGGTDGAGQPGGTDLSGLSDLAASLSADGSAYLALVSHPEITIEAGLRALALDAMRRAGLVWSLLLCAVAIGRLATGGHLRDAIGLALTHRWASALTAATLAAATTAVVVPAVRTASAPGVTVPALAGTPLEQAHWSGRLGQVAARVGDRVRQVVEDNDAFYAAAQANLEAAWAESERTDGLVDVTVSDPAGLTGRQRRAFALEAAVARAMAADQRAQASAPRAADAEGSGNLPDDSASADGAGSLGGSTPDGRAEPGSSASPGGPTPEGTAASDGLASPVRSADPSGDAQDTDLRVLTGALTGPLAAAQDGATTAVLTTDLHCNLDVINLVGRLDQLAGADVHLDDGDLTMTGSQPEQVCVDALTRAVPDGVARVSTTGNHDSDATADQLRARGWEVTDGGVVRAAGLRVLGDTDADRTPVGGTVRRGLESVEEVGQRLAQVSCTPQGRADVVLIHQPYTFGPLVDHGCVPLLLAGHTHAEGGMTTAQGARGPVVSLRSGAGLGGTSIGPVRADAYVHVLSFDRDARLVAWRAVVLHPDASVTVSAWRQVPQVGQTIGAVEAD